MRRKALFGATLVALTMVTVLGLSSAATAASPAGYPKKVDLKQAATATPLGGLRFVRSTNMATAAAATEAKPLARPAGTPATPFAHNLPIPRKAGLNAAQPTDYGTAKSLPIQKATSAVKGLTGLTGYDQEAFHGTPNAALEPPDSEICAGNGTIVQVVNNLIGVWDQAGHQLTPPIAAEYFFDDFESSLFDPKCYWDPDTRHYFITWAAADFSDGLLGSGVYIAVSQTDNPVAPWNIYFLDLSNPFDHNCGGSCFADQPLLGADKWTIQVSTNEFTNDLSGFNGAGYFLIDKTALALGLPSPNTVGVDFSDIPTPDGDCPSDGSGTPCWYSVQPAESPNGNYDLHQNGLAHAMSALDFSGTIDDRAAIWIFTNTKSISGATPDIALGGGVLPTNAYAIPPFAVQPSGFNPTGYWWYGEDPGDVGPIETNDDRMNEVEFNYKTGWIMGALNTGVYVVNHNHFRAGLLTIAYKLQWINGVLFVVQARSSYIANLEADTLFGSSTSVNSGNGIWAYTVTGESIYPSTAISGFTNGSGPSRIVVTHPGKGPEDGFCEYQDCPRWGDYSGAVTDGNTVFWTSEFIDQTCDYATYDLDPTCGGTRGWFINWANSIGGMRLP